MTQPPQGMGAAIMCDLDGVITRIAIDQLDLAGRSSPGTPFPAIFDPASAEKAAGFIAEVVSNGAAFDWELTASVAGALVTLHCTGCRDDGRLWVIVARTHVAATLVLEEMSLIHNEQTGMLRAAMKEASLRSQTRVDESHFDDLTNLYNEQGRIQRELAQRNAELEALRAELTAANAKLTALASTDELTGIANRRAFQERLELECARAVRYFAPLALLILDVDHFKEFNDTFGHQAGDDVLRKCGRLLAEIARETDLVARYGGEEFVVILSNTGIAAGSEAAERLRSKIETEQWPHRAVTVSIGMATWEDGMKSASELIERADQAMYYSKQHGRNRVTHWLDIGGDSTSDQIA